MSMHNRFKKLHIVASQSQKGTFYSSSSGLRVVFFLVLPVSLPSDFCSVMRFQKSEGVIPLYLKKLMLKVLMLLYPTSKATSMT